MSNYSILTRTCAAWDAPRGQRLAAEGRCADMARQIRDGILDQIAVVGNRDQIAVKIKERRGSAVKRVVLAIPMHNAGNQERLETLTRQVQAIHAAAPLIWG